MNAMSGLGAITVGSVCSGIGAPEHAWTPLGWRFLWQSEIEPFPSAVLAERFPGVPNLGDMTTVADSILSGEVEAPDVLVGGTPCQSFSVAGLRGGLSDARGNLALEFIRLADAIDAVRLPRGQRPVVFLWENVPGVLSDKHNAFGCFLSGLCGEQATLVPGGIGWTDAGVVDGPGRRIAWRTGDAQYFGLAQRRRRVFVVASAGGGADPVAVLFEPGGVRRHPPSRGEAGEGATVGTLGGTSPDGGWRVGADEAAAGRLIPALANALRVPSNGAAWRRDGADNLVPTVATALRARDGAKGVDIDATDTLIPTLPFGWQNSAHQGASVCVDHSPTLDKSKTPAVLAFGGNNTRGPIDVATAVNAHGGPCGRMDFESETFVASPMAVAENSRAELRWEGGGGQTVSSLKAGGGKPGQSYPAVQVGMAVRRLTPQETERLQGFPDGFTAIPWRGRPASKCPDGPRYKAIGNSMAVPVLAWIGRRIAAALASDGVAA